MKILFLIVVLANTIPLVAGFVGYQALFGGFQSQYLAFTLFFWTTASLSIIAFNMKANKYFMADLISDLKSRGVFRFLLFITLILIAVNSNWIFSARELGIDNRALYFKIFFLFEDTIFIVYALQIYFTFNSPSLPKIIISAILAIVMISIFGRFGLISSAALVFVVFSTSHDLMNRKSLLKISLLFIVAFVGVYWVEFSRTGNVGGNSIWDLLADRIGEIATLSVVDHIFSSSDRWYFSGFENLKYLYAPSIMFSDKPIINDGSVFLLNEYGLGEGDNGTRFPVLLHVDAYRRFGWNGIFIALLPGALIRLGFLFVTYIRRMFGIPFLPLILLKYSIFIYPKSVLGLIEVYCYAFVRSVIIVVLLTILYRKLLMISKLIKLRRG